MLSRSLFLCCLLVITIMAPANSMVAGDMYRDQPDLFCPAQVVSVIPMRDQPSTEPDLGTDDTFAVKLVSDTPKTVSGTLQVLSHNQPFKVAFSNVVLTASAYSVTSGKNVVRSGTKYYSAPLYFALPHAMPLTAVWIFDMTVNDKAADCATQPLYRSNDRSLHQLTWHEGGISAEVARAHAPSHPTLAVQEATLDMSGCLAPIKEGEMTSAQTPVYPRGVSLTKTHVLVELALDAAGRVADASVLQSSGFLPFDAAALAAGVHSHFNPRLFLCSSIPGRYLFRVNFEPYS